MASSGSFSTNQVTPSSRTWYWDFSWWVTGWNGNTASIHWEVYNRCTSGSSSTWIANYGFNGSIAGHDFSSGDSFYKDSCIASGDFTLGGGSSFSAWVEAHPYSGSNTSSGDGSWTLDNNVTTPTVTVSMGAVTETTIACSMSVTHNGYQPIQDSYIDLFTDSGCTNKVGVITGSSGTFTGLSANTTYYARANASNGYYRGYSSVPSKKTSQWPYVSAITTADLTIGNKQKVTLYNPHSRNVTVYMKKDSTSGTQLYSGTTTGTSLEFTPTASTLYNSIPAATSGNCVYYCTYSSHTVSSKSGTYKVSGNNAQAPTFTDFNYEDTDSQAVGLTGKSGVSNPGILISGMSNCKFTVTTAQKATSSYGATLDKYNFAWPNGTGATGTYSSSAAVTGTVSDGNTSSVSVSAYDKRGQYTTKSKSIVLISPSHASGTVRGARQNGINATTYLNGNIKYWAGDWANGSSRPNNLLKVEYRVNKTGSYYDITSAVTANSTASTSNKIKTLTLNSNTIQLHANGSSGGFTVGTSYTVEIFVTTGYSTTYKYETQQKVAEIAITSGVFGLSRYKDSSGNYHYGFNGLPDNNYTVKVNGKLNATQLSNNGAGSWIGARDYATINNTKGDTSGSYSAVVGQKTKNGHWTIGHINNDNDNLEFVYTTDTNYNAGTNNSTARATLKPKNGTIATLLDVYPVGAIYLSTSSTNPGTLFGGTWTQISGRFLYCTNTSNTTGGSSTINLAHTHQYGINYGVNYGLVTSIGSERIKLYNNGSWGGTTKDKGKVNDLKGFNAGYSDTQEGRTSLQVLANTDSKLSSSQSIMPPWYSVYAWRRTA